MNSISGCEYRIVDVEPTVNTTLTDYVLNVSKGGYFIGIIRNKYGGTADAIGIDV